ncbi:polymer-forming cytoskeletal protein [Carnobacterium sp. TMP28]|uniref:polymer-forming cytoskeletal protein n=1 Tax=Carnobacterium sp. TMP28 TaxID=3397060 RepID=UPI0039DFDA49
MLNKKRGLFLGLCASLVIMLAGCGSDDEAMDKESMAASSSTAESTEVVAGASISSKPEDLVMGLSEDGGWIFAATDDITLTEDLVVAGTFYDKDDDSADIYRKLALYAQDEDRTVTAEYTLTVPTITVESPNFKIENGTVVGDIIVKAEGFTLANSTVEGNVTFDSQELMDASTFDGETITGETTVAK